MASMPASNRSKQSLPGALSCFSMDQPCLVLPFASSANESFGYDLLGHRSSRTCSWQFPNQPLNRTGMGWGARGDGGGRCPAWNLPPPPADTLQTGQAVKSLSFVREEQVPSLGTGGRGLVQSLHNHHPVTPAWREWGGTLQPFMLFPGVGAQGLLRLLPPAFSVGS